VELHRLAMGEALALLHHRWTDRYSEIDDLLLRRLPIVLLARGTRLGSRLLHPSN
jgi:hypothetical protein